MEHISFLETHEMFQVLRVVGLPGVEFRALRLVSGRCRELYDVYMTPEMDERIPMLSGQALGNYTFLHILGRKPPSAMVRVTVKYLISSRDTTIRRENPYIRHIVPLDTIQPELDHKRDINVDNLVRLYGPEAITRKVLSQNLHFGLPELLHTYVPRVLELLPHPHTLLAQMLLQTLPDPDAPPLAPTIVYWLRDYRDPDMAQLTYWRAIANLLAREKYSRVSGINSQNTRALFSEIPETWTVPEYLWRQNGWLILALDSIYDGPLMKNLRTRSEYPEFCLFTRMVCVELELYKIIPHYFRRYFHIHEGRL